jgi:hypothetical protein
MNDMRKLINLMEGVQAVPGVGTKLDEYIRYDSPLKDINDYRVRMKELQKIQMDPRTARDPQLKAELTRKKVMLDQEARELGFVSEGDVQMPEEPPMIEQSAELGIGAKVYPRWSQKGEPFEIVGMTQSGYWVCVDDYGNRGSIPGEDLVLAPQQQVAAEDIEKPAQVVSCDQSNPAAARDACAMEEDINNGYDDVHYATGGDYFPNGADGPVVKAVGPSGARQGDNPEQKKMQVAETHKELVYSYRKYLKESATSKAPKKKLTENQQPVISNVEVQDYVGDFDHDGEFITYEGTVSLSADSLSQNGQVVGIGYDINVSVKAPYSWESDESPSGYNYSNDTIQYSSSTYASVGDPMFTSISLSTEQPMIVGDNEMSAQDAQQVLDPNVFKAVLDPRLYQAFFAKQMTAQADKMEAPEPDFNEPDRDDYDDRY